jgi:formate dehydrogenase major subunit
MGSNMAENHPVGFQWVMEARDRGAEVIHVDPRYTRTSAVASHYVQIRAGSDIAFLGGIVHYILEHERDFRDYVVAYTNAPVLVDERFRDTEDLDGLFSGWDERRQAYDPSSWQYAGLQVKGAAGEREAGALVGHAAGEGGAGAEFVHGEPPQEDPTLQDPRCVYQILKRHFRRYTPARVSEICGCRPDELIAVADALCANSGRERTSAIVYSLGWTQHTTGVQTIRAAAIVQLLLGNIGRPGGGILALRGHASIQGSTDVPTLYDLLPGYIPMPHARAYEGLAGFVDASAAPTGFWGNIGAYTVSLLKAYWGAAATLDNDFGFGWLPRISGDHSAYSAALGMLDGSMKGYFLLGQNPAVGSSNSRLHRLALARLDWLVVRDLVEIESASFWHDAPELETGELQTQAIPTEVFLLPAASHVEKDGTFTNTQRLLQWRQKAVEPRDDCRSDLWFMFHLGEIVRRKLAGSREPRDRPALELAWSYPTNGEQREPSAEAVLRELGGIGVDGHALSGYSELRDDGSTACGCWIYCGCFANEVNQPARKKPHWEQSAVAPAWGWAWPANRRILYNRASADPQGRPWSERKRYVWWDAGAKTWTGEDDPDFVHDRPPDYAPPDGARAQDAIAGTHPFVMQADGRGWLFAPAGLLDGPLPAHYEPHESPFSNALYAQRANPARERLSHPENPYHPADGQPGADSYPYVMTTYRLTEHHTAGGMSRTAAYLAELQPEMFCEVSPELAEERGLEHGGWATIISARSAIEARVLVTKRLRPLTIQGSRVHQVGLPWHWGSRGLVTGDAANDLFHLALDPNVHIQETKAASCDIRPGRRPRGSALRELVESYPRLKGAATP